MCKAIGILLLTVVVSCLALSSKTTGWFAIVYAFLLCACLTAKTQKKSGKDVDDDNS